MNLNAVVITGNLTKDVELRTTQSGHSVATLRVAVNEREKQGEEWGERANYFDVTVWGKQAESAANYLSKGSPVAVQGRLRHERWQKEGSERSKVVIVAYTIQFLPSKKSGGSGDGSEYAEEAPDAPSPDDTDIPF